MPLPRPTVPQMRGLALASLVANILIVVTGGAVRLTGSGLGCPSWPQCSSESFVSHPELGIHGLIEFGNRLLTFVVAIVVGLAWLAALRMRPRRRDLIRLSTVLLLGIPFQAVMGGMTVLTDLNPWVVSAHFLVSPALITVAVVLVRRVGEPEGPVRPTVPVPVRRLAIATFVVTFVVMYVGTIVTGSGPHAGDARAPRNGLDPEMMSQLHADLVFLLVGLTIGTLVALRATGAPARAQRAATWLLIAELAQGVVGFTQYFTGLPAVIVGAHLLGAALTVAAAIWTMLGTRERVNVDAPAPAGPTEFAPVGAGSKG
ncbi:COX15/CtaA family protein [Actinopolymorpha alba]|uniref:COX15/CtaA family protein n=1 Tax=Actinopolymorpha alba TaxID=533267 RepID=UPI0004780111|nr:COX15/CtaA family protein [Actinopolymorpha alba]